MPSQLLSAGIEIMFSLTLRLYELGYLNSIPTCSLNPIVTFVLRKFFSTVTPCALLDTEIPIVVNPLNVFFLINVLRRLWPSMPFEDDVRLFSTVLFSIRWGPPYTPIPIFVLLILLFRTTLFEP